MKVIITKASNLSKIDAFARVETEEGIQIPGFKIQEWDSGQTIVYPPSAPRKDKYMDVIIFSDEGAKTVCYEAILQEYEKYKRKNNGN